MNNVEERLACAIAVLKAENRLDSASISEICRLAKVSRANVYASHRQTLIDLRGDTKRKKSSVKNDRSATKPHPQHDATLEVLRNQLGALRYICLELTLELEAERKRSRELVEALRARVRHSES